MGGELDMIEYFFSRDRDLVSLLLRLLTDETDHLLDLLGHISVVHLERSDGSGDRKFGMDDGRSRFEKSV